VLGEDNPDIFASVNKVSIDLRGCLSRGCWSGTAGRSAPGRTPAAWAVTGRRCSPWRGTGIKRTSHGWGRVRAVGGDVVPLRSRGDGGDRRGGAGPGGGPGTYRGRGEAVRDPGRQDRCLRPVPREDAGGLVGCLLLGALGQFGANQFGLWHGLGHE